MNAKPQIHEVDLEQTASTTQSDDGAVVIDEDANGGELPAHAVRQPDGSVLLPLRHPVTMRWRSQAGTREEVFSELRMRRLTGADMRAIQSTSEDAAPIVAIGKSAGIELGRMAPLYDRMDGADVSAASQVVGYFLGSGRKTGR